MPKKPYLRKLESIEDFEVMEVDGEYIRNNIDREFTNFGQHYRFPFIPTHELWIDKEQAPGETQFFIDHMLKEWHLMRDGHAYSFAVGKADELEKKERMKSKTLQKLKEKEEVTSIAAFAKEIPKELYKKKLEQFGEIVVWIVNGELVRDLYYIEFTEGGHHFVYNFVPLHEVWLDDDLSLEELGFVLLHELHERHLMALGYTYNQAHRSSSIIEYKCRRNTKLLQEYMLKEVELNTKHRH